MPRANALWRNLAPLALAVLLLALVYALRGRLHLDGPTLARELAAVSWPRILLGIASIYAGLALRALRWSLLSPGHATAAQLVAPTFIGFGAVALFGRVVDLGRPYLIARRAGTSFGAQLAVYSLERALDLAAAAILFVAMLLALPARTPHRTAFVRAGGVSVAAAVFFVAVALLAHFRGETLARRLPSAVGSKILDFREGLLHIGSASKLLLTLALSLLIWLLIAFSYVATSHSMRHTSVLVAITLPGVMLLIATSMGASLLQLPVVGWFTQAAALAAAYSALYGIDANAATTVGLLTVAVNTLSIIPAGVFAAHAAGTSLAAVRDAKTRPAKVL